MSKETLVNINNQVVICPVCYGKGIVPEGFYRSTGFSWVANGTGTETCKSCNGKGYVVI